MNFKTLAADQGFATMPFGVRLTTAMTDAVRGDYGFAFPADRSSKIVKLLKSLKSSVVRYYEARETVRQLSALDNRLLMDIGVERTDIQALAHGWK